MVIKKIFEDIFDEEVHADFLKFGRGEFKDRYLIEAKKQKDKIVIKTSAEFANFLVKKCLQGAEEKIAMKGIIVSTMDLRDEIGFEIIKQKNFQGIRQLVIDTEISPQEILNFMEKYPRIFFALSFKINNYELKIKAKPPKSAKPGKKSGDGPKANFCSLKTNDLEIVNELLFDVPNNWKEVKINHVLKIEEILYPNDLKEMKPEEIREQSKRKGVLVRNLEVDGSNSVKEKDFEV